MCATKESERQKQLINQNQNHPQRRLRKLWTGKVCDTSFQDDCAMDESVELSYNHGDRDKMTVQYFQSLKRCKCVCVCVCVCVTVCDSVCGVSECV